ncbi:MAG: thiamine phosphate synthase [Rhodobacteraceae bacterium]|nr:thiamine phosphate synthase [Paracoccaceae bacterium]
MPPPDRAQVYLVTPPDPDRDGFDARLASVLDAVPVACLRLRLASQDEDRIIRSADRLRDLVHARDIPLVIDSHVGLVERLGLDGVHLTDGARSVRKVRKTLGDDAIVGAHCGASRHDGITAGESGADYVAFGPAGTTALGTGERATRDLFAWWSEMIEIPVVAEGALDAAVIAELDSVTDFFAFGDEIWQTEDPAATLRRLVSELG